MTKRVIRTSDDLPRDHWIAQQLPRGTSLRAYAEDEAISVLTSAVQDALDAAGISRAEAARVLGTTKSYISQVLNGSTNMTLKTLGALLWVAGRQVRDVQTAPVGGEQAVREYPVVATVVTATSRSQPFSVGSGEVYLVRRYLSVSDKTTALPYQ